MPTTELATGTYFILDQSQGRYVGRSLREDMSTLPKPVVSLPSTHGLGFPKVRVQYTSSRRM